jgi:hypothetical protein
MLYKIYGWFSASTLMIKVICLFFVKLGQSALLRLHHSLASTI